MWWLLGYLNGIFMYHRTEAMAQTVAHNSTAEMFVSEDSIIEEIHIFHKLLYANQVIYGFRFEYRWNMQWCMQS